MLENVTMTHNALSLDGRIASAFGDDVSSDEVAALVAEVEDAAHAASEAAERARERALDPALPTNEVAEKRRAMEDAAFTRDHLSIALSRLQQRLEQLRAAEEDARCRAAYEKAKAERAPTRSVALAKRKLSKLRESWHCILSKGPGRDRRLREQWG